MKKIITWVLLLAMAVGLFAGCKKQDPTTVVNGPTVAQAMDYVKAMYPNEKEAKKTAVDYERLSVVRISDIPFTVVWTTDASEDLVKIVDNNDGTVTVDVNELWEGEDTPYTLTATITNEKGDKATHDWNYILPTAADMGAIVDEAYALQPGQSMDHEVTLTGVITVIKTPYDPSYKNITVIIEVAARPGKPIECYRLKGEGIEELAIGDTITVTGTLKNYNGTIEFDAGCICENIIPGERVQAPEDMKQIVDEAYALGANKSLPYEATLTGEIIEIGAAYDPSYKNITVTIAVEGREDKPIVCYRMKGDGCEKLKVTDVITVRGYITNYVGSKGLSTIEFTAGCQLVSYTPGAGVYTPTDPAEIMRIAKALGANQKTKFEATLTGVITEVNTAYSSEYDNVSVTMEINGTYDEIYCYRIKGDGVSKIGVGDTITVKGYIMNYVGDSGKSKLEFVAGSKLVKYVKGVKTELPSYNNIIADTLVVGQAYKLGQEQTALAGSPWYYFNGKLANDFYLGTNEDGRKAVDVFVSEVSGGYNLYYKDATGATQYINIVEVMGTDGKLHVNMDISATAKTVYTFDADKKILTTMVGETAYCIGTYNSYTTMAARKVSGIEMPAYLLTLEELTGSASMEEAAKKLQKDYPDGFDADKKLPTSFEIRGEKFTVTWTLETTNEAAAKIVDGVVVEASQEQAVNYKLTATITKAGTEETTTVFFTHTVAPLPKEFVESPVAGTAYKMGMYTPKGILLFTGKTESSSVTYRLASIDDSTKAANVYLEEVSGGYLLYFMDGETKTYINIYENQDGDPGYGKGSIELVTEKPTNVLTYDSAVDTLVYTAPDGENKYFMGTYSTYTTFSVSNYSYIEGDKAANIDVSQFPARFYPENIVVEPAPIIEPDKETLTIAEAIEFGLTLGHNTYSNSKYYVTGVITEVSSTTYGNMKIKDAAGNTLTLYGTYSADGSNRYDAMSVKPVVGDTITVYGIIGQYSNAAQMKNGWITEHISANPTDPTEPEETEPVETEPAASNEIRLTVNSLGLADQSYTSSTATVDGVDFEWFELGNYGNGIQVRSKNGNSYLFNTSAFGATIKEIRMVYNAAKNTYTNADAEIISFGNEAGNYTYETTVSVTAGTTEYVVVPDAETYTFVKFYHNLSYAGYWDSVTIVLTEDVVVPDNTEPEETEPEETEPVETEPAASNEIELTVNSLGLADQSYTSSTATVDGVDFEWFELGNYGNGIQVRSKNGNSYLFNTSAFGATIKEIRMVYNAAKNTYTNADAEIISFGNEAGNYTYETTVSVTAGTTEYVVVPDAETYTFVKFYHNLSYAGYWDSVTIVLTEDVVVPEETTPEETEPEETTVPEETEPAGPTLVTEPVTGTAYKFAMNQVSAGGLYYFNGALDREKYLASTSDVAEAVDVYLELCEDIEGAAYLYFMDDEVKTYITMEEYLDGSYYKAKAVLTTEVPAAYFTWSEDLNTIVCNTGNDAFCYGTYGTYTTFGCTGSYYVTGNNAANVDVSQFIGRLYTVGSTTPDPEETTPEETEPAVNDTLTIEEAIALGTTQASYTTEKYYVTGKITSVSNTTFGNMYIEDESGNSLLIYGTYDADGTNRYDAMDVKPVAGDTVTVYGIIGQFNGTPQMKNGWITEHILGVPEETEPEETTPGEAVALKAGDKVVIYCPAYNKALSSTKTGFYNVGVDVTVDGGVMTGYAETEIWTVGIDSNGYYTFSQNDQNIGLAGSYSSMNLGEVNDTWTIVDLGDGLFTVQNVGRGNYLEWYNSMNNWSTYNKSTAASDPLFQMSFYIVEAAE